MTKDQLISICKKLALVSRIYGITQTNDSLQYQAILLNDLDYASVSKAIDVFARENKTNRPPTPAQIRDIVNPPLNSKDVANELARRIDKAVSKYGWNWSEGTFINGNIYFEGGKKYHWTFKEAVIAELGPVGWHVICSRGGWTNIRNSANEMNEGMFIAQLRDQVQSSYTLLQQGVDITKIELPDSNKSQQLNYSNDLMKAIELKRGPNE